MAKGSGNVAKETLNNPKGGKSKEIKGQKANPTKGGGINRPVRGLGAVGG